jgi:hypothetical protein
VRLLQSIKAANMNKLIISLIVISVLSACDSGNSVQITDSCYIDSPSNGAKLATSQDLLISGWAFDKQSANSPEQVSVQLNGESIHPFKAVRVKRPDVVNPPEAASIKPKAATLVTKEIKVTDKVAKTSKQKTKTSKVPNKAAKKQKSDQ